MKITGGCHCGAITYEAEVDPGKVSVCHCTDCQTLTGSAFRIVVPAKREGFKLKGEPKIYVKTGESGRRRAQGFCYNCGTPIYSADVADPQVFNIRVGTARQRADRHQICTFGGSSARCRAVPTRMLNTCGSATSAE